MAASEIVLYAHCATANRVPTQRLAQQPVCGKCGKALFAGTPVAADAAGFD
jgi:thioredoxin 2